MPRLVKQSRIAELDSLRGLAALAVVLFHYTVRYQQLYAPRQQAPLSFGLGEYGVDFFFILSGFVICMTLDRRPSAGRFLAARFSRLYPTFWAAVAITWVGATLGGLSGYGVSARDAIVNLSMLEGLAGAEHVDGAYWSLQVELLFYAGMLVVYLCGALRRPLGLVGGWMAISMLVEGALQSAPQGPFQPGLTKIQTLLNLSFAHLFALGILLFVAWRRGKMPLVGWVLAGACLAMHAWRDSLWSAGLVAGFAIVLWGAVSGRLVWLRSGPLVGLGLISYPLYLTHQNLGYLVLNAWNDANLPAWAGIFAAISLALGLAYGLHRFVEAPSQRWFVGRQGVNRAGMAPLHPRS